MPQQFLYEQLDSVSKMGFLKKEIPNFVAENLNSSFELREYQKEAFEPDYLLFLVDKTGKEITYQLFLEPKGKYLVEYDKWKNEFLEEIKERFKDKILEFSKSRKYKIIGLPFYNQETENDFKEKLFESIK
ncbi:MAG: hypothetical protein KAQ87_02130 [Candidatus Pacebacteria bacterium]|nr:hypothetical protein [Candidatus Paceibacterota bacterium]